jgi:nucleotide-binding universal stress UspA family protein
MSPLLWGAVNDADHVERLRGLIRQQFGSLTGRREDEYEVLVERGFAHAVLARLAVARGALLVVGSHMHHGVGHALLRDVTERVVERTRGPVLVTRPCKASDRILVAIDRSFSTSVALDVALDEARSSESKLTVLHAIDTGFMQTLATDLLNGGAYADRPLGQGLRVDEARMELRTELRRRHAAADVYVAEGEAEWLVPQIAARIDAEVVVVGTAHRPARTPHVTTAVLRHAPCSVLIVDDGSLSATHSSLQLGT